eukprot:gene44241-4933_t
MARIGDALRKMPVVGARDALAATARGLNVTLHLRRRWVMC